MLDYLYLYLGWSAAPLPDTLPKVPYFGDSQLTLSRFHDKSRSTESFEHFPYLAHVLRPFSGKYRYIVKIREREPLDTSLYIVHQLQKVN